MVFVLLRKAHCYTGILNTGEVISRLTKTFYWLKPVSEYPSMVDPHNISGDP